MIKCDSPFDHIQGGKGKDLGKGVNDALTLSLIVRIISLLVLRREIDAI